jgi:phosphogluconate dehydratase
VDEAEFNARPLASNPNSSHEFGLGRELFTQFRTVVTSASDGGNSLYSD